MRIEYFSVKREYEIKCKIFLPENQDAKNVIVGVHGFAGDKESSVLKQLAFACSGSGTALICFDFPAHGDSPVTEELLTIENCKRDLCAVVDYTLYNYADANISIFATSFGGYIALQCAEIYTDLPMVLRAPAVTMPRLLLENVLKISEADFEKAGFVECGFERQIKLPYAFYEDLIQQENVIKKKIEQPSLILQGDCDDIVSISDVMEFCKIQSNTQLEIICGADHRFKNVGDIDKIIFYTKKFLNMQFHGEDR